MKLPLFITALVLGASSLLAGAQDEQPSSVVSYNLNPSFCGITGGVSSSGAPYLNCYGVQFALPGMPAGSGGSTWIYTSTNVYTQAPYGWGFFFGPSDLVGAEYTVTSSSYSIPPSKLTPIRSFPSPPYTCNNNCTTFTANIQGTTPDDGGTYSAVMTATVYYYYACGSGRGGGGCGNHAVITGGTLVVTYN
jgi:hypothetical protein